jgi:uncharacterized RDD family membrane protein YckC
MQNPKVDLRLPKARSLTNPAPFWKRGLAFIVDMLIFDFITFIPLYGFLKDRIPQTDDLMVLVKLFETPSFLESISLISTLISFLFLFYFVAFEIKTRQTPGKMLLNLYVIADENKEGPGFSQVLIRNLIFIPVIPFTLLWIIDPIYMIVTGRRLCEILSKTRVIEEIKI